MEDVLGSFWGFLGVDPSLGTGDHVSDRGPVW